MNLYRAGEGITPYRVVRDGSSGLNTFVAIQSTKANVVGIAQTGCSEPGARITVADREGDHAVAEAGGEFEAGAEPTADTEGRLVLAPPGARAPVYAIAEGAATRSGQRVDTVIAPRGMTT